MPKSHGSRAGTRSHVSDALSHPFSAARGALGWEHAWLLPTPLPACLHLAPGLQPLRGSIIPGPWMGNILMTQGGTGLARGLGNQTDRGQVMEFLSPSWPPACLVTSVLPLNLGVAVCGVGVIGPTWGILPGGLWVLHGAAGACPACSPHLSTVTPCPLQAHPPESLLALLNLVSAHTELHPLSHY